MFPDHEPHLPLVYLDWNTVQHLRKEPAMGPLLEAVIECRLAQAALFPYSIAHVLDATAGWTRLAAEHRAEALRDMIFLDGLTSLVAWEMKTVGDTTNHYFTRESIVEAAHLRGQMSTLRTNSEAAEPELLAADEKVRLSVDAAEAEMRRIAETAKHPLPPDLVEEMIEALRATLAGGVAELSDSTSVFSRIMAPSNLHMMREMAALNDVAPERVVEAIEQRGREQQPTFSFMQSIEDAVRADSTLHLDDLGPGMLGLFGFHRDKTNRVKSGSPGVVPDQFHGRHGLASAIFISGERRLPHRLDAWAAHTGRGRLHETWPLLRYVPPDDPAAIDAAAALIRGFASEFEGSAEAFLAEFRSSDQGE